MKSIGLNIIAISALSIVSMSAVEPLSLSESERTLLSAQAQRLEPKIEAKSKELTEIRVQLRLKMEALRLATGTYQARETAKLEAVEKKLSKKKLNYIDKELYKAMSNVDKIKFDIETLQDKISALNILELQPLFDEYYTILIKLGRSDQVRKGLAQLDSNIYAELKAKLFYAMGAVWVSWVYGKDTNVGFEIVNTSDDPIWVSLKSGDVLILDNKKVDGKGWISYGRASAAIDIYNTSNQLLLYRQDAKNAGATPTVYQFKPDKTMYVLWNGTALKPQQEGVIQKATHVTLSGYSLLFNVTDQDIMRRKFDSNNKILPYKNNDTRAEIVIKNTVALAQLEKTLSLQSNINLYMNMPHKK